MRKYYIFRQRAAYLYTVNDYNSYYNLSFYYKWLPFECLGYVEGIKELYITFKKQQWLKFNTQFVKTFIYDTEPFLLSFNEPRERFLILDDSSNIRDFYKLTEKYRKKKKSVLHKHQAYQHHSIHIANEKRKSLSPAEIDEVKEVYGITLQPINPKRKIDLWDYTYRIHKKGKGWKDQTKRTHQYKDKEIV